MLTCILCVDDIPWVIMLWSCLLSVSCIIAVAWPSLLLTESKIYKTVMVLSYSIVGKMRPIFCGNFEYDARPSDLERLFSRYGKVERVDMKSGKISRPSCVGFVFFFENYFYVQLIYVCCFFVLIPFFC